MNKINRMETTSPYLLPAFSSIKSYSLHNTENSEVNEIFYVVRDLVTAQSYYQNIAANAALADTGYRQNND